MNSPGGGSRHVRRSPSFFSSRRGFGAVSDVVAELDCADRVWKAQTATSITAIVANVVLTEFEFMRHISSHDFITGASGRYHSGSSRSHQNRHLEWPTPGKSAWSLRPERFTSTIAQCMA